MLSTLTGAIKLVTPGTHLIYRDEIGQLLDFELLVPLAVVTQHSCMSKKLVLGTGNWEIQLRPELCRYRLVVVSSLTKTKGSYSFKQSHNFQI